MSFAAAIPGIVGAGSSIANAAVTNSAQQSALGAQEGAINSLQPYDIASLNSLATTQDLAKYQEDFAAQAQYDPLFASMRTQGAQGVLGALASNANPLSIQNQGISNLQTTTNANVKANQPVIDQLLAAAKAELAGGATLPPAFQAEMIRSGLAGGGAAGTGVAGEGATGVGVRTLLGSAGQAYQAQEQQMAQSAAGTAGSLEQQQQAALNELTQLSMSLNTQKAALAGGAVAAGNATVPSIGLVALRMSALASPTRILPINRNLPSADSKAKALSIPARCIAP